MFRFALIALTALACSLPMARQASAQDTESGDKFVSELITEQLPGRSISARVVHRPDGTKVTRAIAIFPGYPGILGLQARAGEAKGGGRRGNVFFALMRPQFLEENFVMVLIDAPSTHQGTFWHGYRASESYGEDIKAVLNAVSKKFGMLEWTFLGHSEGTISAAHAARMLSSQVKRVVLSAPLTSKNDQGPGLQASDVSRIGNPVLFVHHRSDQCRGTGYAGSRQIAQQTRTPILTVTASVKESGGVNPCFGGGGEHFYNGIESQVAKAILSWISTGQAPADVAD